MTPSYKFLLELVRMNTEFALHQSECRDIEIHHLLDAQTKERTGFLVSFDGETFKVMVSPVK